MRYLNPNKFLFATGHFSDCLIATYDQVAGSEYGFVDRNVEKSSVNSSSHKVKW